MVLVNVQIAARLDLEVESAMAGKQLQHVVEKADAGGNLVASAPVQVQPDADVGFCGLAVDARLGAPSCEPSCLGIGNEVPPGFCPIPCFDQFAPAFPVASSRRRV